MAAIQCTNLSIGYGSTEIQHGLNFALHEGEMVCMLGRNGCGKSTLFRTLAGLQVPLGGEYTIMNAPAHAETMNSQIALVLTERLSVDNTTIHDVVAMGRYPYTSFLGGLSELDEEIIAQSLRDVGLYEQMHTFFNDHSDGEKQRVLIAKALAQQTPIIFLDEPTAHLDLPNRIHVLRLLHELANQRGKTILISTHELDLACQFSNRILLMYKDGIQLDTPDNMRANDAFTKAFGMDVFQPLLFSTCCP